VRHNKEGSSFHYFLQIEISFEVLQIFNAGIFEIIKVNRIVANGQKVNLVKFYNFDYFMSIQMEFRFGIFFQDNLLLFT
jgi:hypothetical protein